MIDPAKIAFDVDGVVADTMSLFLALLQDQYNITGIRLEDITDYHLSSCLDIDHDILESAINALVEGRYEQPLHPIPHAPQVLKRLAGVCKPVRFITARPVIGPMQQWFKDTIGLGPDTANLTAVGAFEAKTDVLLSNGISWFVEDRLETCHLLHEAGILPILFRQPWNRKPHPFQEVDGWAELENLIDF